MKRRIVLHIGLSKTGTTSIQTFLWRNRDALADRGILYPDVSGMGPAHPRLVPSVLRPGAAGKLNHVPLALELRTPKGEQAKRDTDMPLWSAVFRQIEEKGPDTTIISYENFHVRPETYSFNSLSAHFREFDVHGIIYLRPLEDWMISLYSQDIKGSVRQVSEFSRYVMSHLVSSRYSHMLDAIAKHLPINSISIGDFYLAAKNGLIRNFLDRAGISEDKITADEPAATSNASLPIWATLFLLRCNRRRMSDEAFMEARNALSRNIKLQRWPAMRPGLDVATPSERLELKGIEAADQDRLWERHGVKLSHQAREPIVYRPFDDEDFTAIRGTIESRLSVAARSELDSVEGSADAPQTKRRR